MKGPIFVVLALAAVSSALPRPASHKTLALPGGNIGRIVGGVEADRHEFPWIVDMRRGSHYCGGTIISPEWVVTAAHCSQGSGYTLTAGDHNIDMVEGTEQTRDVVSIIIHPGYQAAGTKQYENDIALMKVFPPFEFNEYVSAATIAQSGFPATPLATVTGWGTLSSGGQSPSELMKVDVPFVSDVDCNVPYTGGIADSMICYGEGGKDSCQGDSGGPIMCGADNTLCGIVSWGRGCALEGYPGVYTEVSYFADWIQSATVPTAEDETPKETVTECGGVLEMSSARINFQVAAANTRCVWTVKAPYDTLRFRLTASGLGANDGIFVTRGDDTSEVSEVGADYRFAGGLLIVTLSAGNSAGQAFSLDIFSSGFGDSSPALSGFASLTAASGSYSYPVGGGEYGNSENALFIVSPNKSGSTMLTFTQLDVEDDSSCDYDAVTVYSWSNNQFVLLSTFCGTTPPASFTIPQGLALVKFTTDSSITETGFTFAWE